MAHAINFINLDAVIRAPKDAQPALRHLEDLCLRRSPRALVKYHIVPAIRHHLRKENMIPLDASNWSASPEIQNALSCFSMVTAIFERYRDEGVTLAANVRRDVTDPIWSLVKAWSSYFIKRTNILTSPDDRRDIDLIFTVERLLSAFVYWIGVGTPYMSSRPEDAEFTCQLILPLWIRCAAFKDVFAPRFVGVIYSAIHTDPSPGRVGPMTDAVVSHPTGQFASALVASFIDLMSDSHIYNELTTFTLCLIQVCLRHEPLFVEISRLGLMSWMVRFAFRMISKRPALGDDALNEEKHIATFAVTFGTIHKLLTLGYEAIVSALDAHFLEASLLAELCVLRYDHRATERFRNRLSQMIDGVVHFLNFRSVLRRARQEIRRIEAHGLEDAIREGSPLLMKWMRFRGIVAAHEDAFSAYKLVVLTICANPQCRSAKEAGAALKRCSGCLHRAYCSVECQRADWMNGHRVYCHQIRLERTERRLPHIDAAIDLTDIDYLLFMVTQDAANARRQLRNEPRQKDRVIAMDYRNASAEEGSIEISFILLHECRTLWPAATEAEWRSWLERAKRVKEDDGMDDEDIDHEGIDEVGDTLVLLVAPFSPFLPTTHLTSLRRIQRWRYGALDRS
ncbi:hypothetical protein CYLTODRAFT_446959 [Cylindrobasidium torrendii FP15055 ss-10]|uniref:phytol kinase n=1 Tax=Cylindrobasidium torrendii FP15055 ss-10 TaxID=1314674 RepID=A0A0D7B020_9AGAR|nr:hypothetical protein CYLTODRAFT_446959 [Cylindrobasidium torrendii FP15055 ss-10]